ncbi:MAG: aldo/keto reductase [Selenomonadaceae bacterium]|nr:aldo/keto reductase [Selenomonadaceae bacterium]
MKYQNLGSTGMRISKISYGGIVSAGYYDHVRYPSEDQKASDYYVSWAIDHGVNYFDVAPGYGDAQEQLGNSLQPYRKDVFLACKTNRRERAEAEIDLANSLERLKTDYFDVYQLHGISSMRDVDRAFGPGGVMELVSTLKDRGIARHIGFTAHSEEAALRMLDLYPFETVLFPINWFMNMAHGMGSRLLKVLTERGLGKLAMKAFIERAWEPGEDKGPFPKSWCKPINTDEEPEFGVAAMNYTLSLGVDTLIPPGNFKSFRFAVEHIDSCDAQPDMDLLRAKLETVRGKEFFQVP